jgi:DUF1680 family protein
MRLVASLGHYMATADAHGLQIHQYGTASIAADLPTGGSVALRMASAYPWDGQVRLKIESATASNNTGLWMLGLRVPGWCAGASVRVNGQPIATTTGTDGYLRIARAWAAGDVVDLDLPMPARLTEAHPWIESTRGCVAIERGPLVYCVEQADQEAPVYDLEINPRGPLSAEFRPDLLDGVAVVNGFGYQIDHTFWQGRLYRPYGEPHATMRPVNLTAIPVYAWANRGPHAMKIWLPFA